MYSMAYALSMPERLVRVLAAVLGGAIYQITEVLLPNWLRGSRFYQATVARGLRITVELVGGVLGVLAQDKMPVQQLAMRKAAGNVMEMASLIQVGWSPLWLLAATADITGGTRTYLRALEAELKRNGLLAEHANVSSFENLLDSLEGTSAVLADTIDVPPLSVGGIRASWNELRRNTGKLPGPADMASLYSRLQQASNTSGESLLSVSTLVAEGAVLAGIKVGNDYIVDYYREALGAISREGFNVYARRVSRPYFTMAQRHMDPVTLTYTDRALQKLRSLWPGR